MLPADSPLRRLPTALDPGQAMFFNAIRFSAEVLDAGMRSLRPALQNISNTDEQGHLYPAVMLLAWSVVDSANRFRVLIEAMRRMGWLHSSPLLKARLRVLDGARPLRDAAQHLDDHIKGCVTGNVVSPVWGSLSWFTLTDFTDDGSPTGAGESCMLMPGSVVNTTLPAVNPAGKEFAYVVDQIQLHAFGSIVSLSLLEKTITVMVNKLEESLRNEFAPHPDTSGADLLIRARIEPTDRVIATPRGTADE